MLMMNKSVTVVTASVGRLDGREGSFWMVLRLIVTRGMGREYREQGARGRTDGPMDE